MNVPIMGTKHTSACIPCERVQNSEKHPQSKRLLNQMGKIIHTMDFKSILPPQTPVLTQWVHVQKVSLCQKQRHHTGPTAYSSPLLLPPSTVSNVQPQRPVFNTRHSIISRDQQLHDGMLTGANRCNFEGAAMHRH